MIAAWHPIPSAEVIGWWEDPDVRPFVMLGADGEPVGYGEIWLDSEEDEVELARLILPAELRGRGFGQRLVRLLEAKADTTGLALTMLRVEPDNDRAIRCYLACDFERLGPEESAEWNKGQRREWVWMTAKPKDASSHAAGESEPAEGHLGR